MVVLIIPLSLIIATFPSIVNAYGSHFNPKIYGTILEDSCYSLDGEAIEDFTDLDHSQLHRLCKIESNYMRIITYNSGYGCIPTAGLWKDPKTGKEYSLPTPCDVPRPCDPSSAWASGVTIPEKTKIAVKLDEKQYDVYSLSTSAICEFKFSKEAKQLSVSAADVPGTNSSIAIAIPIELLSGNFTVMINGIPTNSFSLENPEPSTIPDTKAYEQHRSKFDTGLYDKIIHLIDVGVTRNHNIIIITPAKSEVADLLKLHNATNIHAGQALSFVTASVPVREIPLIATSEFVQRIGDGGDSSTVEDGNLPSFVLRVNFTQPEGSSNDLITESKIDIIGTEVVPEFSPIFIMAASLVFLLSSTTLYNFARRCHN